MTLPEKIGQMNQIDPGGAAHDARLQQDIREGRIGSILNEVDTDAINELQRIAVEGSRLATTLLDAEPELILEAGDVVAVLGSLEDLASVQHEVGQEVMDPELLY
jgi:hypothetical protein